MESGHHMVNSRLLFQLGRIVGYPFYIVFAIFRRVFGKSAPAITLENADIKYPLRLVDKEVNEREDSREMLGRGGAGALK